MNFSDPRAHGLPSSFKARAAARLVAAALLPAFPAIAFGVLVAAPSAWADGGVGGGGTAGGVYDAAANTAANGATAAVATSGGGGGSGGGDTGGAGGNGGGANPAIGGAGGSQVARSGQAGATGDLARGGGGGGGGAAGTVPTSNLQNGTNLTGGNGGAGGSVSQGVPDGSNLSLGGGGGGGGGAGALVDAGSNRNDGTITGGSGGQGGSSNLYVNNGTTMSTTVLAQGGAGGKGGTGLVTIGTDVQFANGGAAAIRGGRGGDSYSYVQQYGNTNTTQSSSGVTTASGSGGDGIHAAGSGLALSNEGLVQGGASGNANANAYFQSQTAAGFEFTGSNLTRSGAGGAGVRVGGADAGIRNTASGTIRGGDSSQAYGYIESYLYTQNGLATSSKSSLSQTAIGGRGGDGIVVEAAAVALDNAGNVSGGTGGSAYGYIDRYNGGTGGTGGSVTLTQGGAGGDGVALAAGGTVTNRGQISGGAAGGAQNQLYFYGSNGAIDTGNSTERMTTTDKGGAGVALASGSLANEATGVIAGGASAQYVYGDSYLDANGSSYRDGAAGGAGGAGVSTGAGSVVNAGLLRGGDAVQYVSSSTNNSGSGLLLVNNASVRQQVASSVTAARGGAGVQLDSGSVLNQAGARILGGNASGNAYANVYDSLGYNSGGAVSGVALASERTLTLTAGAGGAGLVMTGSGAVRNDGLIEGGRAGTTGSGNSAYSSATVQSYSNNLSNVQGTLSRTTDATLTGYAGGNGIELAGGALVNSATGLIRGGEVTNGATAASSAYLDAGSNSSSALRETSAIDARAIGGGGGHGAALSGAANLRNDGTIAGGNSTSISQLDITLQGVLQTAGAGSVTTATLDAINQGGAGGDGARAGGTAALVNAGAISGGDSANALRSSFNLTLDQSGSAATSNTTAVAGTLRMTGGAGGAGVRLADGAALDNSGTVTGGNSLDTFAVNGASNRNNNAGAAGSLAIVVQGGAGGAGIDLAGGSLSSSGSITGGNGGAVLLAANGGSNPSQLQDNVGNSLTLAASAGAGAAAVRGTGMVANLAGGVLQGGNGGAVTSLASGNVVATGLVAGAGGSGVAGANLTVVNAGVIQGGLSGDGVRANAVSFTGGVNRLVIEATSEIRGNVQAFSSADTFALGGATDASFDVAQLDAGAQYRGFGNFEKTGAGKWTLTGSSDQAIDFTVRQGRLANNAALPNAAVSIGGGGTLAGNGAVGGLTALAGSTVAPGNSIGTLTVNGNYSAAAGSVYQVEYDGLASDLIRVTGTASLAAGAGLQAVHSGTAVVPLNVRYTVLSAAGGVTGRYTLSGETIASPFVTLRDTYDAGNVYLEAVQTAALVPTAVSTALTSGYSVNQINTGLAAQGLAITSGLRQALLYQPTVAAARAAFDQISGEAHASLKSALVQDSHFVRDAANDRLRTVAGNGGGTWARAYASTGRTRGDGNAQQADRDIGGAVLGADAMVGAGWRFGAMGGYSRSESKDVRSAGVKSDNYTLGVLGGNAWDATALRLGASYTWHRLDTQRSVAFAGYADHLRSRYDGATAQVFGELGHRFNLGTVALEPFAGLAHVRLRTDAFSERGGLAVLQGARDGMDTSFATLGLRASTVIGETTQLRGMLGWRHAFGDLSSASKNAFAGGQDFVVYGVPVARNVAILEAGFDTLIRPSLTLGASFIGQFGSGAKDSGVKVSLAMKF